MGGSDCDGDGGMRKGEGGASGGAAATTQGEKCLFTPKMGIPNPERDNSGSRNQGESDFNFGDAANLQNFQEEEKDLSCEQQSLPTNILLSKDGANLVMEGKETVEMERCQKKILGNISYAIKERTKDTRNNDDDMETNQSATKRGSDPKKPGSVYVGQWNQIKERMEWNLMEGGMDEIHQNLEATSPILGGMKVKHKGTYKKTPAGSRIKCNLGEAQVSTSGPMNKVGEKRKGAVDGSAATNPGSSTWQADVIEKLGGKKLVLHRTRKMLQKRLRR
jgi:hypothetical protein